MSNDSGMIKTVENQLTSEFGDGIPIQDVKQIIKKFLTMEPRRSMFLWGPPGIGKTSIAYQAGLEENVDVNEITLTDRDPVDFGGVPVPLLKMRDGSEMYLFSTGKVNPNDVLYGTTRKFVPEFLRIDTGKPTLIFLDEMNHANKEVLKVAQQLVLEYRVGDVRLPDNCRVIAAGNEETHQAFVQILPKPLQNRFIHLKVRTDLDGWINWSVLNGIHPMIIAYIKYNSNVLFQFDAQSKEKAFPTPRTWEFASDILKSGLTTRLYEVLCGTVGKVAATGFVGFMELFSEIPDIDMIFKDPAHTMVPNNPSLRFSLCVLLARRATYKNIGAIKIYSERMGREFCSYTVKYINDMLPALRETPEYVAWAVEYSEYFVDDRSFKKTKVK